MDEYIKREDALDAVLFALVGTGYQSKAIDAIRDIPTADVAPRAEWISVEERLPEENGVFIVSLKESGYEYLVYFDVRSYADGEWRNIPDKFTVSHWMPLPEPPQMKGGAE
jgi:hypothetical protein